MRWMFLTWNSLRKFDLFKWTGLAACLLLALVFAFCTRARSNVNEPEVTDTNYHTCTVRHIVLFRFRKGISEDDKQMIADAFMKQASTCIRDNVPYIMSIEYGFQSSNEDTGQGSELGFIVTFSSEGDRNYYVGTPYISNPQYYDPVHAAFKTMVAPYLSDDDGVIVFDYRKLP